MSERDITTKPTTYFDVTQLVHWQGRITGIPRVMEELAVRYQKNYPDTVFVSWVKEIREFCEIDFPATLARRGHGIIYLQPNQSVLATEQPTSQPVTLAGASMSLTKRALKKGLRATAHYNPRIAAVAERRAQNIRMARWKRAELKDGDALFIPWGEWWDGNFIVKLEQLNKTGVELIQVLHDMSPVVVPQFSNSGNATETFPIYCRRILPICKLVLSVSQNSRRDAINWLQQNKLKIPAIEVFRLGDDIETVKSIQPENLDVRRLQQGFLLMVGTIELKKNHQLLYYVYKLAKSRGIDLPPVVIAGRYGWMTESTVELMTKDPEVKDKFIFMIGKSDQELSWLYDNCLFTVLPSFYEGWGIPIAESVARGVPCLCSNTSSMTEVAEGYVEHFSPSSTDECLAGIQKWLDPNKLAAARTKVAKYVQYSWDDSFKQVDKYVKDIS